VLYRFADVLSALDILGLQRGVVAGEEAVWFDSELSSTGLLLDVPASVDILKNKIISLEQKYFKILCEIYVLQKYDKMKILK
jgi:hypothetical protein